MTGDEGGGASRSTDPAAGTSAATDVSLREYLSALLATDRTATRLMGATLVLFGAFAWSEIQRRLEILNHENARLLQQQERTVSQDTYVANEAQRREERKALEDWRKEVDSDRAKSISREEFQRDTKVEKRAASSYGWQWAAGLIGIVVFVLTVANFWMLHN